MKSKTMPFMAFITMLSALLLFQNCGDDTFKQGNLIASKNNGNGYQGANTPAYVAYHNSGGCGADEISDAIAWQGVGDQWAFTKKDCNSVSPVLPIDSASLAVSDDEQAIVVLNGVLYSGWNSPSRDAMCAVILSNKKLDRDQPVISWMVFEGQRYASVTYRIDDQSTYKTIHQLPFVRTGDNFTVSNKGGVTLNLVNAKVTGTATLDISIVDKMGKVIYSRSAVPMSCFSNAGTLSQ